MCLPSLSCSPKQAVLNGRVAAILDANPGKLITYGYLAREVGHCPDSLYLCKALGHIQAIDTLLGQPLRPARVVRKDRGKPGPGFWDCARALGYPTAEKGFWRSQCEKQGVVDFDDLLM